MSSGVRMSPAGPRGDAKENRMLWTCRNCTTSFAVGLPYCPHCTGTDIERDEEGMPKSTVHGGVSNVDQADELAPSAPPAAPAPEAPPADLRNDYRTRTIAELRVLLRERELQVSGDKPALVARLEDDDEEQGA